ncbi:MAG: HAD hydrolase family protein, partial [Erysipelotrichaceae bacterium]|nr:HAD hydrolase family protein [Erysipelotrichaceae bacterium]
MIKKVSAVAADIDGTLVTKGSDMMPITRNALIRLHEKGILVGIATGRCISSGILRKYEDWGLPFQF